MKCPNDSCEIEVKEAELHIGLLCTDCKGVWLPRKYIDSLCRNYSVDANQLWPILQSALGLDSARACPECEQTLRKLDYSSIELHCCAGCEGVWFDEGQLTAMEKALLQDKRLQHRQHLGLRDAMLGVFRDLVKTKPVRA